MQQYSCRSQCNVWGSPSCCTTLDACSCPCLDSMQNSHGDHMVHSHHICHLCRTHSLECSLTGVFATPKNEKFIETQKYQQSIYCTLVLWCKRNKKQKKRHKINYLMSLDLQSKQSANVFIFLYDIIWNMRQSSWQVHFSGCTSQCVTWSSCYGHTQETELWLFSLHETISGCRVTVRFLKLKW